MNILFLKWSTIETESAVGWPLLLKVMDKLVFHKAGVHLVHGNSDSSIDRQADIG